MKKRVCFLLFILQLAISSQFQVQTYKAAVVEYYPIQNRTASPEDRTHGNVAKYIELLDSVKNQNLDIIVFPESTITTGNSDFTRDGYLRLATIVPEPEENISPCKSEDDRFAAYFKELSCAALDANTYLVANLMEKSPCTEGACAADKWNMYNCDVAFDREGTVVARYRKFNLFGEYPMNTTKEPDITTFTTDFGVTFGVFTCFDLLFDKPALELVRQGVKHIIFPTMWFSELPFLTALQAQNMWAVENNVVFLAAGANNPAVGSGGSGAYLGKYGPLDIDIIGEAGSKIYVSNIYKTWPSSKDLVTKTNPNDDTDKLAAEMDGFYFKLDNLIPYASELVNLSESTLEAPVCYEEFCCNFSIKLTNTVQENQNYYQYRMVAFSGVRYFDVMHGGVDVCGIVFCTNSTLESCGTRFAKYEDISWPIKFQEIVVTAKFSNELSAHQYPNTLLSSIRPLPSNSYQWSNEVSEDGTVIQRTIKLIKPQNRLMTFGIFGRDVSRDEVSAGNSFNTNILRVIAVNIILKFLNYH